MSKGDPLAPPGMLACFSADSACTKNPVPMRTASQKINLAAFDLFMLLVLFCASAFPDFPCLKLKRSWTLCDSAPEHCAGASKKRKQKAKTVATKR
jgi:hypothetical protein